MPTDNVTAPVVPTNSSETASESNTTVPTPPIPEPKNETVVIYRNITKIVKEEVAEDPTAQYSNIEIIEGPDNTFYLEMAKRENATYMYNDGLIFHFDKYYEHFYNKLREMENKTSTADLASGLINHDPPIKRPQHIRFSVNTPSANSS